MLSSRYTRHKRSKHLSLRDGWFEQSHACTCLLQFSNCCRSFTVCIAHVSRGFHCYILLFNLFTVGDE